jgi:hypothetical protein
MGIVPAVYFADRLVKALAGRAWPETRRILLQILLMLVVFFVTVSPQLALWYRLHGSFISSPQPARNFVSGVLPVHFFDILFHTNRGLVYWCPFVLIGMAGIALIPDWRLGLMAASGLLGHILVLGYRPGWFSGGGFGARYFVETLPYVAVGFASLLSRLSNKTTYKVLIALCAIALLAHQFVLLYSVEHASDGWVDLVGYLRGKPLGIRWQWASFVKLARDPSLWLKPRPYVGTDRRTILTNLRLGVQDWHAYRITGTAALLAPVLVLGALLVRQRVRLKHVHLVAVGTTLYFFGWSIYLYSVG